MVTQIRTHRLRFKDCGQDVLRAFLVKQGAHVISGEKFDDVPGKERTKQLRLLCLHGFPGYA